MIRKRKEGFGLRARARNIFNICSNEKTLAYLALPIALHEAGAFLDPSLRAIIAKRRIS